MTSENPSILVSLPHAYRDKSADWLGYYHTVRLSEIVALINDRLIAEHKANPTGYRAFHSPDLQRVLNYMRSQPVLGKYFIYTEHAWSDYRIATIGERGTPLQLVGDERYASEEEAMHAVFMLRVADIKAAHKSKDDQ